jgi:hypothetical protein
MALRLQMEDDEANAVLQGDDEKTMKLIQELMENQDSE